MSLKQRLLVMLLLSFSLLWSVSAYWLFVDLSKQMQHTLDQRLAASARMVAGLLNQLPQGWQQNSSAVELPDMPAVACEISLKTGEVLLKTHAGLSNSMRQADSGYSLHNKGGEAWRVYTLKSDELVIRTADRVAERQALSRQILLTAGLPFIISLCGSLLLAAYGIHRGLKPLLALSVKLKQHNPLSSTPITIPSAPKELTPVLNALNHHLAYSCQLIKREQAFAANAAHELRTPLTAIKTHAAISKQLCPPGPAAEHLVLLGNSVLQLQHTVEQLLLLARLDSAENWPDEPSQPLAEIIAQSLSKLNNIHRIECLNIEPVYPALPAELVSVMLRNLLDNALKYSLNTGPVCLDTEIKQSALHIYISDPGPGISADDIEQAMQPFWRKGPIQGSGLGLTLVQNICQRFNATLSFKHGRHGFTATLTLPLQSHG